ncbi:MAG: hypothetical protein H7Y17_16405 [Chlorobia bacterium]|nr:hypothetical protein [Fimbriimonadaceae bacterium]
MSDALARLLDGVIDYAGLFPPAKLSMADAVGNFLRYRSGPEAWIVDRFVCSSAKLEDFRLELDNQQISDPIPIAVIGTAAADKEAWGDCLVHDAEAMTRFIQQVGDAADIEAFEIRVPDHQNLAEYLRDLRSFSEVEVYCELPWSPAMQESLGAIAEEDWLGAKARTGGLEPSAFPTSENLAVFIQQCIQLELDYKLTAGLHHPVRGFRDEVGAKMHGFLNVLVASTMANSHDLTTKEVADILECENADEIGVKGHEVRYGEWIADLEDIEDARSIFMGIGSCSIEEPLQDLRDLNLL